MPIHHQPLSIISFLDLTFYNKSTFFKHSVGNYHRTKIVNLNHALLSNFAYLTRFLFDYLMDFIGGGQSSIPRIDDLVIIIQI